MLRAAFSALLPCAAVALWIAGDGILAPAVAQNPEEASPLISAEEPTPENGYVPLQPLPEIVGAPVDAEFIFLSGYAPSRRGNRVDILLDRPGSDVVLILSSYEPVVWNLEATTETSVRQVLVGGYHDSVLRTDLPVIAYDVDMPYANETQNRRFRQALEALHEIYGIDSIDYHFGQSRLPERIEIRDLGRTDPTFALAWPKVSQPTEDFRFILSARNFRQAAWTATGPVHRPESQVWAPETVAFAPDGRTAYRIASNGIEIIDLSSGNSRTIDVPPNFERISWPEGIAYDSANDFVVIVSSGGGGAGAFYRFDAAAERWKDFRMLNRRRNLDSLSFDPVNGVYVAARQREPGLFVLSPDGEYLEIIDLGDALPGIYQTFDRNNRGVPSLSVVPHGRHVAIMMIADPYDRATSRELRSVRRIWLYDRDAGTGQLTYQSD